jgi:GNAT superfamily N-acetyltransferase
MGVGAVHVLRPSDAATATDVLTRGFAQEPAKIALVPEPKARRALLDMSMRNRLHDALRRGTAHAALDGNRPAAVAVWAPPGVPAVSITGGLRGAGRLVPCLAAIAGVLPGLVSVLCADVRGLLRLVRGRSRAVSRASEGQVWNLALLATTPEHRGLGFGRALLERQLRRCDEDRAAIWLETTDPVNVPIYERFGFETVAHMDGPTWLPGLWVMRRDPKDTNEAPRDRPDPAVRPATATSEREGGRR